MLALKYLLLVGAIGMFIAALAIVAYDLYAEVQRRRRAVAAGITTESEPLRWRTAVALVAVAWAPLLIALSIVVVPSGMAGVRVSQVAGTRPGTLYSGVHVVTPFIDRVEMFDTRDHLYTTGVASEIDKSKDKKKVEPLNVQAKEGLTVGLAITVRYSLDPNRLDYIQSHLPQPVDTELVPAVVASAWRELVPNYTVRDVFSTKREEVRQRAEKIISSKLGADGIRVKEVMLRDIQLPPEYAKGLETLLLREQENDRIGVETEIQQKQVRISELQAEAQKVREVKGAEGQAQVRVLQAKGESDAMQYMLPLKQKQIEQSRLEAEARKETTIKNAEAAAQAKVIDSKAELERRNLLADAEANRIRVTAVADAERMRSEAAVLKQNPLLINKIVAERLSDKIQVMMVPSDGKFFFANDVLRSMGAPPQSGGDDDPPPQKNHGQ
ncbi:MAG TPA: SPFH domain-containing protein [Terriglobales bacterium]|jgi:regulator of protease activity HflC (stomatin/prohibitin superfamily)|nr:SPFH domain-containing protein [Terriglobales bacterium]